MRKRRAFISFPEQPGDNPALLKSQKILDGLNLRFKVELLSDPGLASSAHVDIYNLKRETLDYLTTSASTWLNKRRLMQLYAGYDDDVGLMISGEIMEAMPIGNPDVALRVKLLSDIRWQTNTIDVRKDNIKIGDLLEYAAGTAGYAVNMDSRTKKANEWLNTTLDKFSYTGSSNGLIKKIQEMVGGYGLTDKNLIISTYNDQIFVWEPNNVSSNKKVVSKDTGMIGYPKPTGVGVDVQVLLNPRFRVGEVITLKTDRMPTFNGDYIVTAITHEGEMRGQNWYTTLQCSNMENYTGTTNGKTK